MMLNLFKVLSVFVAIVAVTTMGVSLSTFIVAPDFRAEMNTPAMQNYTFERTTGENPQWTITRRFSVNPQDPNERGSLGTVPTGYDALIKAIQTNLKDGNRVHLTGIGQLEVKVARSGNRKTVHFETSRLLRKAIQ